MDYTLAKKLKDAGFPQKGQFWWFAKSVKENGKRKQLWKVIYGLTSVGNVANEKFVNPTLSELIEACGDDFDFVGKAPDDKSWMAQMTEGAFERVAQKNPDFCVIDCDGNEWGETPEEAVANLWLALNAGNKENV